MIEKVKSEAIDLIHMSIADYGIKASPIVQDNYERLWSRDSAVTGLGGILMDDEIIIEGLKTSLLTLAEHQHPRGMIASNVRLDKEGEIDISYGSLVGRVDATGWFVVMSCLYIFHTRDMIFKSAVKPHIDRAISILEAWEFNGGGLLYTPLSGNWADEYPTSGYTLYDNCLRVWGVKLYAKIYDKPDENQNLKDRVFYNFWPQLESIDHGVIYNRRLYRRVAESGVEHFISSITTSRFVDTFDAAGHGLALLQFQLSELQRKNLSHYLESLFEKLGRPFVPAFWPCIQPGDPKWPSIEQNYSFEFKNHPHRFHNGGIWPIWMGLVCLGLLHNGLIEQSRQIARHYLSTLKDNNYRFSEYINSETFAYEGKEQLCYSASGALMMVYVLEHDKVENLSL